MILITTGDNMKSVKIKCSKCGKEYEYRTLGELALSQYSYNLCSKCKIEKAKQEFIKKTQHISLPYGE